jgi:hypothetical protein
VSCNKFSHFTGKKTLCVFYNKAHTQTNKNSRGATRACNRGWKPAPSGCPSAQGWTPQTDVRRNPQQCALRMARPRSRTPCVSFVCLLIIIAPPQIFSRGASAGPPRRMRRGPHTYPSAFAGAGWGCVGVALPRSPSDDTSVRFCVRPVLSRVLGTLCTCIPLQHLLRGGCCLCFPLMIF